MTQDNQDDQDNQPQEPQEPMKPTTDPKDYRTFVRALCKAGSIIAEELTPDDAHRLHMAIGASGEAGELLDAIKKACIYRKPLDIANVREITKALEIFRNMMNDKHEEQEKQDEPDGQDGLDPSQLIDNLEMMARWTHEILRNNGSDELNEEGGLKYRDYEPATQTAIASAFAYARILHVLSVAIFVLHQGDITEEQFHHAIDEGMSRLEESSPFQDDDEQ